MSILLPPKPLPGLTDPLWTPAPEFPRLPVDELHVWRLRFQKPRWSIDDDGCPVNRDRAEKAKRELFRQDVVDRYESGSAPRSLASHGSALRVATAQCDHLALVAVSRGIRKVGLDLERVREDIPVEEMADGFLDLHHRWDIRITWGKQEKAWKFFQFWTSNEACAQAQTSSRSSHSCEVRGFTPEADFVAALALQGGPDAKILFWDWQF